MSIFGSIVSAIFGSKPAAGSAAVAGSPAGIADLAGSPAAGSSAAPSAPAGKPIPMADVEAMIAKIASQQKEQYNWKQSIVDLMTTGTSKRLAAVPAEPASGSSSEH